MNLFLPAQTPDPLETVIVGGGVAALETLLALHALGGPSVRLHLVAPNSEYVDRAMSVAEPFGLSEPRSWSIAEIARAHGAAHTVDTVAAVDDSRQVIVTASGGEIPYDALVLATGARRVRVIEDALTFCGPADAHAFTGLLLAAESGEVESIAFAVPPGLVWTLPLYELALMTAARLGARAASNVELSIVTPEAAPLALFGPKSSDTVAALLRDAGIALHTREVAADVEDGWLALASGARVAADRVVALPRLAAPEILGVPRCADGFIPTDLHCRVEGLDNVYAAGDATWFPIKQGGIAGQQADVAAASIAALAGAPVARRTFRPVLRGALVTGAGTRYLRHRERGPDDASTEPLWQPVVKIAGRYLGPYLANDEATRLEDVSAAHGPGDRSDMVHLALEAADADAEWGDYSSALRWLALAERLTLALPLEYADKRERWRTELSGAHAVARA
jgi:sulfide:quinone oxidoreductase